MNTDLLRLFLEQDAIGARRFQTCYIEPAFFTVPWVNLGAGPTPGSANTSNVPFLAGSAFVVTTTATTNAANVAGTLLLTMQNQQVSSDVTNVQTEATATFDNAFVNTARVGPFLYPLLVEANGQILMTAANPTGTNVNVFVTFHGVNLFE